MGYYALLDFGLLEKGKYSSHRIATTHLKIGYVAIILYHL